MLCCDVPGPSAQAARQRRTQQTQQNGSGPGVAAAGREPCFFGDSGRAGQSEQASSQCKSQRLPAPQDSELDQPDGLSWRQGVFQPSATAQDAVSCNFAPASLSASCRASIPASFKLIAAYLALISASLALTLVPYAPGFIHGCRTCICPIVARGFAPCACQPPVLLQFVQHLQLPFFHLYIALDCGFLCCLT